MSKEGDRSIVHIICENDHKGASHSHMSYQILNFHHRTHEKDQVFNYVLEFINLANAYVCDFVVVLTSV